MIDIRSFRDIVRLFFIFRRQFITALWITVALIVAGAFLLPTKYASEARLLVKPGRENLTVPIDVGDRPAYAPMATQRDPIIDEEKMLTGRPVVTQVARLYLKEMAAMNAQPMSAWKRFKLTLKQGALAVLDGARAVTVMLGLAEPQSEEERLASKLSDKFQVSHGVGSNVMELRFVWDDPVVAQRIMQTWVRIYTDERTAVLGRKSLVTFYDDKVREVDTQIDALKGNLRVRLEQINGLSASERLEAITKRINDLRDRQAEVLSERTALEHGVTYAKRQSATLAGEIVAERDVGLGPSWLALSTQLAELKRQRTEALRVYKDSAPAVLSLNESIAAVEAQLKKEERNTERSEKRTPNELGQMLAKSELEKSVRLKELLSMGDSIDKELAQLTDARKAVLAQEPELARLEDALQVAEKSRLLYLDSLEKARIDQSLDDSRINNIAVIEAATLNPARVFPKSLLFLALALPAGVVVGLLTIYVCAVLDQRIHDGGRIEDRFGVPLWSTIKDISGAGEDNDFHASMHRIYGTLPLDRVAERGLVLGLASAKSGEGVSFVARHLKQVLETQGLKVRVNPEQPGAAPGEVVLVEGSNLLSNRQAFVRLSQADLIVLVVQARASLVPVVDNALGVLRTAFRKVDGVVLNRRRFEVPSRVLRWFQP
jgi:uncharacterized protein involved in exopolysaccharide biosynthesis